MAVLERTLYIIVLFNEQLLHGLQAIWNHEHMKDDM